MRDAVIDYQLFSLAKERTGLTRLAILGLFEVPSIQLR